MNPKRRILFVCAFNQWRSPTAEAIYRSDPRLDVRSAGVRSEAKRRLNQADVEWAEIIFVMDRKQKSRIQEQFQGVRLPKIEVLDIPDGLEYMHPELQQLLRTAIDPEIEALLSSASDDYA